MTRAAAVLTITLLFLTISTVSAGPGPDIAWERCMGGSNVDLPASELLQTSDDGFFIAGKTSSENGDVLGNHGGDDVWVVKLDRNGHPEWQKCFGGPGADEAHSAVQTPDGGYIVAGVTESHSGDVFGNHGSADAWVVKITSSGSIEWKRCYGGSRWDGAHDIIQTADNGYLVAGETMSDDGDVTGNHGMRDIWMIKLTSSGNIDWQRCLGGSDDDGSFSTTAIQTPDGGYLVAGETGSVNGDISGNHGSHDIWIVKLTSSGSVAWQRCFGGSEWDGTWNGCLILMPDGGYLVAGETTSGDGDVHDVHGGKDIWVIRLTSSGNINWQKTLGGSADEQVSSVADLGKDGFFLTGMTRSDDGDVSKNHGLADLWVVRLGRDGGIIWQKCLGGSDDDGAYSTGGIPVDDRDFLVSGDSWSDDGDVSGNHGMADLWVIRTDEKFTA